MTNWSAMLFVILTVTVTCHVTASAQLAATLEQVTNRYGSGEDTDPLPPATEAIVVRAGRGLERLRFGFLDGRVCYMILDGGRMSLAEVHRQLRSVELATGEEAASPSRWQVDAHQARQYPVLSDIVKRSRFVPTGTGTTTNLVFNQISEITEYYDGWGRFLGQRRTGDVAFYTWETSHFVTGIRQDYLAQVGVARVPLIRSDGEAFAMVDLGFSTDEAQPHTERITVATRDAYWEFLFNSIIRLIEDPPDRLYFGSVPYDYDRALASLMSDNYRLRARLLRQVLLNRLTGSIVSAVDRHGYELEGLLTVLTSRAGEEWGITDRMMIDALTTELRRARGEVKEHRAWALGGIADPAGVPTLISLLQNRDARDVAAVALLRISRRFPNHTADDLGSDPGKWHRWWTRLQRDMATDAE